MHFVLFLLKQSVQFLVYEFPTTQCPVPSYVWLVSAIHLARRCRFVTIELKYKKLAVVNQANKVICSQKQVNTGNENIKNPKFKYLFPRKHALVTSFNFVDMLASSEGGN